MHDRFVRWPRQTPLNASALPTVRGDLSTSWIRCVVGVALAGAIIACRDESGSDDRTFVLSVSGSGGGNGSVGSTPAGISCTIAAGVASGRCQASFGRATAVTLTAIPLDGTFEGWAGACSGAGTCQVTLDRARVVTASFAVVTYKVSVLPAPGNTGNGSVVSSPAGINCEITATLAAGGCIATFPLTANLSLHAIAAPGFEFTGWSGECGGSPCTRAAGQTQVVRVQFTPVIALAVAISGTGSGTVTSSPAGITCSTAGGTCSKSFLYGAVVTLTATPAAGHGFAGWSGACSGTGACAVTLDQARSVTATFNAP